MKGKEINKNDIKVGMKVWVDVELEDNEFRSGEYETRLSGGCWTSFFKNNRFEFQQGSLIYQHSKFYECIPEPRTYTTSEMISELEKNPKLKFKDDKHEQYGNRNYVEVKDGVVCWEGKSNEQLYVVVGIGKQKWKLIEEPKPVPFMDAVKAFSEGKKIKSKLKFEHTYGIKSIYELLDENGYGISFEEIMDAQWFIEEGEKK